MSKAIAAPEPGRVVPITKRDAPKVIALARSIDLFTPEEVDVIASILQTYLRVNQKWYCLVGYKQGDELLGFAIFAPAVIASGTFEILWMAVSPNHQGKGVGGVLLGYVEDELKPQQARLINIETSSQKSYAPTRRFYEKHGYKRVAFIRDYYSPGDGKVVYAKYFEPDVLYVQSSTTPVLAAGA